MPHPSTSLHVLGKQEDLWNDNAEMAMKELSDDLADRFGQGRELLLFDPTSGKTFGVKVRLEVEAVNWEHYKCPACGAARPLWRGTFCELCSYELPKKEG